MKTISIPYFKNWLTEKEQVELEKNLSYLHPIKDFVFIDDRLEVTFDPQPDPYTPESETISHIYNLVVIQLGAAYYSSGRAKGAKLTQVSI